jgi:hypothetical protein
LATPNYGYEKRQRELAKKQKKADKQRAKTERRHTDDAGEMPSDAAAVDQRAEVEGAQPQG